MARYEARVGDNHHHVVCRSCGVIEDVDCAVGHTPCLTASDDHGFSIDEAEVVYWGTCPDCSRAGSSPEPSCERNEMTDPKAEGCPVAGMTRTQSESESENPGMPGPQAPSDRRPRTNRDWWPNRLI